MGIERDVLTKFTKGAQVTAFTASGDSDIFPLFSQPLEEYRISFGARPSAVGAVTAIDAQLLGSIDGTVFDIVLAEIKQSDTGTQPGNSAWDSTNGETVQNIKAYIKFLKVHIVSITTTGSVSFPIIVD